MIEKDKILGTSRIAGHNKVTLVASVIDVLGVKQGDLLIFIKRGNRVFIEGDVIKGDVIK